MPLIRCNFEPDGSGYLVCRNPGCGHKVFDIFGGEAVSRICIAASGLEAARPEIDVTVAGDFTACGGENKTAISILAFTCDTLCEGEVVPVGHGYWRGPDPAGEWGTHPPNADLVIWYEQTPSGSHAPRFIRVDKTTGRLLGAWGVADPDTAGGAVVTYSL